MATNKFLIFDEQGRDMMTDSEYATASQRISGVVPGLAEATMHNKLYRQTSIMANAIGRVLGEFGLDAPDNDVATLAANIKSLFCSKPLEAYPVGSIYFSASGVSPAQLFGGTWEQIKGKFILAADESHVAGSTGGEESHALTTEELAVHNHSITVQTNGYHGHSGTANGAGNHAHSRGTMNITGKFSADQMGAYHNQSARGEGAFYLTGEAWYTGSEDREDYAPVFGFEAARSWTGVTSYSGNHEHSLSINGNGSHAHNATAGNAGSGAAHNNMPPYISVYVWKRIA